MKDYYKRFYILGKGDIFGLGIFDLESERFGSERYREIQDRYLPHTIHIGDTRNPVVIDKVVDAISEANLTGRLDLESLRETIRAIESSPAKILRMR